MVDRLKKSTAGGTRIGEVIGGKLVMTRTGGTGIFSKEGSASKFFEKNYSSGEAKRVSSEQLGRSVASEMVFPAVPEIYESPGRGYEKIGKNAYYNRVNRTLTFKGKSYEIKTGVDVNSVFRRLAKGQSVPGFQATEIKVSPVKEAVKTAVKAIKEKKVLDRPTEKQEEIRKTALRIEAAKARAGVSPETLSKTEEAKLKRLESDIEKETRLFQRIESTRKNFEQDYEREISPLVRELESVYGGYLIRDDKGKIVDVDVPSVAPPNVSRRINYLLREINSRKNISKKLGDVTKAGAEVASKVNKKIDKRNEFIDSVYGKGFFVSALGPEPRGISGLPSEPAFALPGQVGAEISARRRRENLFGELIYETPKKIIEEGPLAFGEKALKETAETVYLEGKEVKDFLLESGTPYTQFPVIGGTPVGEAIEKTRVIGASGLGLAFGLTRPPEIFFGRLAESTSEILFPGFDIRSAGEVSLPRYEEVQTIGKPVQLEGPIFDVKTGLPLPVRKAIPREPVSETSIPLKDITKLSGEVLGGFLTAGITVDALRGFKSTRGIASRALERIAGSRVDISDIRPGILTKVGPDQAESISEQLVKISPVRERLTENSKALQKISKALSRQAKVETFSEISQIGEKTRGVSLFKITELDDGRILFTTKKTAKRTLNIPRTGYEPSTIVSFTKEELEALGGKIMKTSDVALKDFYPEELRLTIPEFKVKTKVRVIPIDKGKPGKPKVFEFERFQEAIVPRLQRFEESVKLGKRTTRFDFPLSNKQAESLLGTRFRLELLEEPSERIASPIIGIRKTKPRGTRLLETGKVQDIRTLGKRITFISEKEPSFIKEIGFDELSKRGKSSLRELQEMVGKELKLKGIEPGKIVRKKLTTQELIDIQLRQLPKEKGKTEDIFDFFKRIEQRDKAFAKAQAKRNKKSFKDLTKKSSETKKVIDEGFVERSFGSRSKATQMVYDDESFSSFSRQEAKRLGILPQEALFEETSLIAEATEKFFKPTKSFFSGKIVSAKNVVKALASKAKKSDFVLSTKKLGELGVTQRLDSSKAFDKLVAQENKTIKASSLSTRVDIARVTDLSKGFEEIKKVGFSQTQKIEPAKATRLFTRVSTITRPSIIELIETPPPPPPPPFIFPDFPMAIDKEKVPKESLNQGYKVSIKQRGKFFMPEDQKPRTRKQAQIYGAGIVDNTAQKTFKLKRVKEKAKPDPSSSFVWQGLSPKFKQKSLNTFVEKNRFGIDTVGELQGITAKGLLKQRQMRMMGIPIKKKKKSRKRRKK